MSSLKVILPSTVPVNNKISKFSSLHFGGPQKDFSIPRSSTGMSHAGEGKGLSQDICNLIVTNEYEFQNSDSSTKHHRTTICLMVESHCDTHSSIGIGYSTCTVVRSVAQEPRTHKELNEELEIGTFVLEKQ